MTVIDIRDKNVRIDLTFDEVVLLSNALNEVCNGIDVPEFETRLGVAAEHAVSLLKQMHGLAN